MKIQKTFAKSMAFTVAAASMVAYLPADKASASTPAEMQAFYDEKMEKSAVKNYLGYTEDYNDEIAFFYLNNPIPAEIPKEIYQLLTKQATDFSKKDYSKIDRGTYDRMMYRGRQLSNATNYIFGYRGEDLRNRVDLYYLQTLVDVAKQQKEYASNSELQYMVNDSEEFLEQVTYVNVDETKDYIKSLEGFVGKITVKESNNTYLQQLRKELTEDLAATKKKNEKEISSIFKTYNTEMINVLEKLLNKELTFERAIILKGYINAQRIMTHQHKYVIASNLEGIERWMADLRELLKAKLTVAEKQFYRAALKKGEDYLKANNFTLNNSQQMNDYLYEKSQTRTIPSSFVVSSEPTEVNMTMFWVDETSETIAQQGYKSIKITDSNASNKTPTTINLHVQEDMMDGILMMKSGNNYTPVGYTVNGDEIKVKVTHSGELVHVKDAAVPLKDIKGNYFEKNITELSSRAIVSGYQNKFEPNKFSTRAEFFTMLGNGLGITQNVAGTFKDAKGKWYDGVTSTLAELGYVQGSYGNVNGDQTITRQDAFTVIGRLLENEGYPLPEANLSKFADGNEVAGYAAPYVQLLMELNIVSGGMDGNLDPKANLTKGQMAKVLSGVLKQLEYL